MAQSRCIGLYGPFTNLLGCAMYFDYKVRDTFNEWYIEPAFFWITQRSEKFEGNNLRSAANQAVSDPPGTNKPSGKK